MKYKTTIKITTEAANKNEAMEIAGEYLSGDITSGVQMKCDTAPAANYKGKILVAALFCFVFLSGVAFQATVRSTSSGLSNEASLSAMQPPLKTSSLDKKQSFKDEWQETQNKKALDYIKR